MARTRTRRILASGRCSRGTDAPPLLNLFGKAAAFLLGAAAFLLGPFAAPCPALTLSGLPAWLEPSVLRSLEAVWSEIPDAPSVDRTGTLSVVASRLFTGFRVRVASGPDGLGVLFERGGTPRWAVRVSLPELREPVLAWFRSDLLGLEDEVASLLTELPAEALHWADVALRERIGELLERRLPGWDFSVQVALGGEDAVLTLAFRPRQPLVLAVTPSLYSATMPAMFQSDLRAKLLPDLSPLIALPVEWVACHRSQVEDLARASLEDRNSVSNLRARVSVAFVPGPVSKVDALVDSDRVIFHVWVAAYAGLEGRYPEAGLFLGWNTAHLTGVDLELYGEAVMELEDFGVTHRLGARLRPFGDLRVGMEIEWPEGRWFYRALWDPYRVRRPYFWWRYAPEWGHEASLGYRFNEHLSVEIYYDGIEGKSEDREKKLGLRGILSL